jgi:cell division protein FtsB
MQTSGAQDELEDLKRLVEAKERNITDLKKQLSEEKLATQRFKVLLQQYRLRMRPYQIGDFVCSAIDYR